MMRWFRLHTGLLNNPKYQRLSDQLKARLIDLWCVGGLHDGVLPGVADVAFLLRTTEDDAQETIEALKAAHFLDQTDRGLQPHDWDEWQYVSDSSTGRVQKHRERKRSRNVSVTVPETEHSTAESESEHFTEHEHGSRDSRAKSFDDMEDNRLGRQSIRDVADDIFG
jgi:hypothetical protein